MIGTGVRMGAGLTLALVATAAPAQFIPPAGYPGQGPQPGVALPAEPGAPTLTRVADEAMSALVSVDPAYRRDTTAAHAKVVGSFAIAEADGARLVSAWSYGFLPVTLSFEDGRCFSLRADYAGGTLSNGRLNRVPCEARRPSNEAVPPPPPGSSLRRIGSSWGYGAWADDRHGITVVTAPNTPTFRPLFTVRMATSAIMAMNGPDWPGGNVTLVGRVAGRLTVTTLEVGY